MKTGIMKAKTENLTQQLFKAIDNRDTEAFLTFLADDVSFRFGNANTVSGKPAVAEAVDGFFFQHQIAATQIE